MLRDKGITVTENMDGALRPGSVVFVQTPDGVTHRDYVTQAWTEHPVKDVLVKMAASPSLTRIASAPSREPADNQSAASAVEVFFAERPLLPIVPLNSADRIVMLMAERFAARSIVRHRPAP